MSMMSAATYSRTSRTRTRTGIYPARNHWHNKQRGNDDGAFDTAGWTWPIRTSSTGGLLPRRGVDTDMLRIDSGAGHSQHVNSKMVFLARIIKSTDLYSLGPDLLRLYNPLAVTLQLGCLTCTTSPPAQGLTTHDPSDPLLTASHGDPSYLCLSPVSSSVHLTLQEPK